jgi:hypothetical protein
MPTRCAGGRTRLSSRRFAATPRASSERRHGSTCLRNREIVCASRKRRAESSLPGPRTTAITGALWRPDTVAKRARPRSSATSDRALRPRHGDRARSRAPDPARRCGYRAPRRCARPRSGVLRGASPRLPQSRLHAYSISRRPSRSAASAPCTTAGWWSTAGTRHRSIAQQRQIQTPRSRHGAQVSSR